MHDNLSGQTDQLVILKEFISTPGYNWAFNFSTGNLASGSSKPTPANSNLNSPSSTSTGFTIASVQSIRSQTSASMGGSRV